MSESFSCSTFTHPLVFTQYVACGTLALVRTHHVNAAEGTQQRILGTLIDVWMGIRTGYSSSRAVRKLKDGGESADTIARTFARHHGPGLKAILARTLKATDDIGACAVAAGIANVALISVCIEDSHIITISVNASIG